MTVDFTRDPDRGCRLADPNTFYNDADKDRARRICAPCPFTEQCRNHAVNTGEMWGIWGGVDFSNDDERVAAGGVQRPASQPTETIRRRRTILHQTDFDNAVRQRWQDGTPDVAIALTLDVDPSVIQKTRRRLGLSTLYGPGGRPARQAVPA